MKIKMQQREMVFGGVVAYLGVQVGNVIGNVLLMTSAAGAPRPVGQVEIIGQLEPPSISASWHGLRPFRRPVPKDAEVDDSMRSLVNSLVASSTSSDVTVGLTGVSAVGGAGSLRRA